VVDFADACQVDAATQRWGMGSGLEDIRAAVFAAGIDSRQGATDLDADVFTRTMQVNCLAHLQILRHLTNRHTTARGPLRVIAISSDVVTRHEPATVVYASTKAALEQALRHATTDTEIHAALVRLPQLSVPMGEIAERGSVQRYIAHVPPPAAKLAERIVTVLMRGPASASAVEVWS
jgi:NAD(P)-dependent dehydrogenase (short-subunit alcohol dehydrogenase family)